MTDREELERVRAAMAAVFDAAADDDTLENVRLRVAAAAMAATREIDAEAWQLGADYEKDGEMQAVADWLTQRAASIREAV